jgi:hypothetical protein
VTIEGDLEDIGIASVVQVLCSERRRTGMQIARKGVEGLLCFDEGQIVHSRLGLLEGEEAIYQLLSWREGRFRISQDLMSPDRSISLHWNELLLEGMRRFDERSQKRGGSSREIGEREIQAEEALESDLLDLLARLEQVVARLDERKRRRGGALLSALAEMVNMALAFTETASQTYDGVRRSVLVRALALTNGKYPYARLLVADANRISVRNALKLHESWDGSLDRRRYVFSELSQALGYLLDEHLAMLGTFLRSEVRAERWRAAVREFGEELTRTRAAAEY